MWGNGCVLLPPTSIDYIVYDRHHYYYLTSDVTITLHVLVFGEWREGERDQFAEVWGVLDHYARSRPGAVDVEVPWQLLRVNHYAARHKEDSGMHGSSTLLGRYETIYIYVRIYI